MYLSHEQANHASYEAPKERLQLSRSPGLEWTTADCQVGVPPKCDLIIIEPAYGNMRLYKLTPMGALNRVFQAVLAGFFIPGRHAKVF